MAVVLLSGGLDSATCLAVAREEKKHAGGSGKIIALSFDYGQKHRFELEAARDLARHFAVDSHIVLRLNLDLVGGSALTTETPVPRGRGEELDRIRTQGPVAGEIPVTYVPARNSIFLACAASVAESHNSREIFIGVNALDYSGYPDCRPEFIASMEESLNLGTGFGARERENRLIIRAPLQEKSKAEIVKLGATLGVDYSLTHSCYDPDREGRACGECDACYLRKRGFTEAGLRDPTHYQS